MLDKYVCLICYPFLKKRYYYYYYYYYSFLDESSSFLQVTRTTIKAWVSLNFCQIHQLSTEVGALECLKNQFIHFFSVTTDLILF